MITLKLENFEILKDKQQTIKEIIDSKVSYFNELLKRYPTEVTLELKFSQKPSGWKVDAYIEMQSGKTFFEESGKDIKAVVSAILNKIKDHIKKTKALERKDYEYKRAKYRKKKLSQKDFELLVDFKKENKRAEFDNLLKDIYDDLHQDIKENFVGKGKNDEEAEILTKELMEKIKEEIYETFTASKDQRDEFLDSISDISHYWESK